MLLTPHTRSFGSDDTDPPVAEPRSLTVTEERELEVLLRNTVMAALVVISVGALVLIGLLISENRHRQTISSQKRLLDSANRRLRENNDTLARLIEEKDDILGIVAHDLRNPLTTQLGFGELLQQNTANADPLTLQRYAKGILNAAHQMDEIITILLTARRLEKSAITPRFRPAGFEALINKVVERYKVRLAEKHQTLELAIESIPDIYLDPALSSQILDNLVSNAIKYSPKFSTIGIKLVRIESESIEISVIDEGPGVLPEEISLLFEKFKTTSNLPTDGESSIGLGLSVVKQFAELVNAKIRYEPNTPTGSRFIVTFPFAVAVVVNDTAVDMDTKEGLQ